MSDDYSVIYATSFVDAKGRKGTGHVHFGGTPNGVTPDRAAQIMEDLNLFPGYREVTIHPSRAQTPTDLVNMVKMVPKEPRSAQILVPAFAKTPKPQVGSRFETLIGLDKDDGDAINPSRFGTSEEGGGAVAPAAPEKLVNEAANGAVAGVKTAPEGADLEADRAKVEQAVKADSEKVKT
jgi:hypothetical protein